MVVEERRNRLDGGLLDGTTTVPTSVMLNGMVGFPHFVMVFSADYVFVTNEANPGRALKSIRNIEAKPRFCYNS